MRGEFLLKRLRGCEYALLKQMITLGGHIVQCAPSVEAECPDQAPSISVETACTMISSYRYIALASRLDGIQSGSELECSKSYEATLSYTPDRILFARGPKDTFAYSISCQICPSLSLSIRPILPSRPMALIAWPSLRVRTLYREQVRRSYDIFERRIASHDPDYFLRNSKSHQVA